MMAVTTQIIKREEKGDNGTGWDSRASKKSPELLPGIPDHIVITTILPKLSWTMLQRFITVSRRWLHAFQDGEIFEARISAKTTKTMFIYFEWIKNFNVKAIKKIPFFSFPSGTDIRSVEQEVKSGGGIAVTLLHGRFLKLTPDHIDAYDGHTNTWTPLHLEGPFEFSDSGWSVQNIRHSTRAVDVAIIRIKNEIYSVVRRPVTRRSNEPDHKLVLMKSEIPVHPIGRQEPSSRQQSFAPSEWRELKCKPSLFKGVLRSEPSLFEGILRCPIQL